MARSDPASRPTSSTAARTASFVVAIVATGVAIWLVAGDARARSAVEDLDAVALAAVLGLLVFGLFVSSWLFRLAIPSRLRRRIEAWTWHHLFAVGRLLNLAIPQAGMAYRSARLRTSHGIPIATFVGSLAVINWLSSGVAAVMAGVVLFGAGAAVAGSVVMAIGVAMLVLLVVLSRFRPRRQVLPDRMAAAMGRFGESFRDLARNRALLVGMVLVSLVGQVLTAAAYVIVSGVLGVADPIVVGTVLYAGSAVVSVVTLTPGSLGITELVSAAAGSALAVGAGIGVVVSLVVRVVGAIAVVVVVLIAAVAGGTARSTAARAMARRRSGRSLRVLHVASSYPFDDEDSTAPFMAEMLEALAAEGVEVTTIVPDAPGMTSGSRHGVEVVAYRFPFWRRRPWGHGSSQRSSGRIRPAALIASPVAMLSMARSLRREIRRRRPDVVHLHWLVPQGVAALVVPRPIPIVLSVHGAGVRLAVRRPITRPLVRWALGRIDHVFGSSRTILDQLSGIVPDVLDRASIVEHGAGSSFVPGDRIAARRDVGIEADGFVVLGVGRLVPLKGFLDAISAVASLDPPVLLVIAGEGSARSELVAAAEQHGSGRVRLLGAVGRSDLARWYAAADCVVIPSVQGEGGADTGPVVLVEALASGRPVVSTRVGMAPRLVLDGVNGYLVPESDPGAIAAALERVRSAAGSLDDASRRSFEHHGGWDRFAADVARRYEIEMDRSVQPM